jgi:predicted secreted protein
MTRAIFVCHCLLDPLTRAEGTKEIDRNIIKTLIDRDISIVQLPCPEMVYGSEFSRPPCNKEDYDTPAYRKHCRRLAEDIAETVNHYSKRFTVSGLISIGGSPSCGASRTHVRGEHVKEPGVFMEELQRVFEEEGIDITICDHELLDDKRERERFLR